MSQYRIRKGEREFDAARVETLRELAQRGLLEPSDEVSVDGGGWVAARSVPTLASLWGEEADPWRHWSDRPEVRGKASVLDEFLSVVSRDRMPAASAPPPEPERGLVRPAPLAELSSANIEAIDIAEGGEQPAANAPSLPESMRVPAPDAPLSFDRWVEERSGAPSPLTGFGRYDDGVVVLKQPSRGFSWVRVALLAALGVGAVVFAHTWVRTGATTAYPPEAELIAKRRAVPLRVGDGPAIPVGPGPVAAIPTRSSDDPVQRRAREVALRQRVGQGTRGFDDAAGLEDALFQELQNAGCRPRAARVIAKRLRGGTGPAARRPSEADIELTLSGVDAEGDVAEQIEERLLLAWLLLGKYAEIGHVDLGDVSIRFVAPTPYADQQRGRDLAQFWSGRLESAQLLLGSMNR